MRSSIWLGLTGGIGSGKSTVAALLSNHGAAVIDADAISRQTTAAGGSAIEAIRNTFGPEFIDPDGGLNRDRMRTHVFQNPSARQRLEHIIHPLVGHETTRQAEAAMQAGRRCIVFDIPLLVESGHWRARLDQIVVVDCRPETQIERTTLRSGLTREAVATIIASQASRSQRLRAADLVVFNEGISLDQLAQEIGLMAHRFGL